MKYKLCKFVFIFFTIFLLGPSICNANSAEPPSIVFIVPNSPDDLEISMISGDDSERGRLHEKFSEKYYAFYSFDLNIKDEYIFKVNSNEYNFEITLDKPIESYNNIYTLELKNTKLTNGKLLYRSLIFILMRLSLTLLIEGGVFWLLGFRNKKSWYAFIIINLITQGMLNIWINGLPPFGSYIIMGLIFLEIIIIIVEFIAFLIIVSEYSPWKRVFHVISANLLSLIAGGYLISILPL